MFEEALRARSVTALSEESPERGRPAIAADDLFQTDRQPWKPLRPNADRQLLDVDHLAAIIEEGGRMAEHFPAYEHRPQQVDMLRAVTSAFNANEHLMVEAPTGVGKSLAYLIPAIYWATLNNERVVISTATINLQDQLVNKDLPILRETLGLPFQAAVLKGRSNYLCPRRLATLRRRGPTSVGELRVLAKILVWLLESDSGDKGEITLRGFDENAVWSRLSAEDEGCTLERCDSQMHGACPFYKARRQAEAAHVVVVNHALLLADVQIGSRALPEYRYLVIDEAHHLEEATTNGLSFQINQSALQRRLDDLGTPRSGMLGDVIRGTRGSVPGKYFQQIEEYVQTVSDALQAMSQHVERYFGAIYRYLDVTGALRTGEYANQVRLTPQARQQGDWAQIEQAWEVLSQFTLAISSAMSRLARGLAGLEQFDVLNYTDLLSSVQAAARHLEEIHQQLGSFSINPRDNMIYWAQVEQDGTRISIHAAPLHVGPLLEEHLWGIKDPWS